MFNLLALIKRTNIYTDRFVLLSIFYTSLYFPRYISDETLSVSVKKKIRILSIYLVILNAISICVM